MNIIKMNEVKVQGKPEGWVVRVSRDTTGRIKAADYGVYIKEDIFVSVPLHFVLVESLLRLNYPESMGEFYGIPNHMRLKLIRTKAAMSGKSIPMLVPCRDGQEPDVLACLSFKAEGGQSIIYVETADCVVREYVDKDRKVAAIILVAPDKKEGLVNIPEVSVTYTTGIINGKFKTEHIIRASSMSNATTETKEPVELEGNAVVKTGFINFANRFLPTAKQLEALKTGTDAVKAEAKVEKPAEANTRQSFDRNDKRPNANRGFGGRPQGDKKPGFKGNGNKPNFKSGNTRSNNRGR